MVFISIVLALTCIKRILIFFIWKVLYSEAKVKLTAFSYFWVTTDLTFELVHNPFANIQTKSDPLFHLFVCIVFVRQFSKYLEQLQLICSFYPTASIFNLEFKQIIFGVKITADDNRTTLRKFESIRNEIYEDLLEPPLICHNFVRDVLRNIDFIGEVFGFHL